MSEFRSYLEKQVREACELQGTFTLRSGQVSNTYFDKYLFESNPYLLMQISIEILKELTANNIKVDYFAGLETGGIPIAVMLSQLANIPTLFVRKKAKGYGTCKVAEGPNFAGKRLCVVEDVITTGGQVLESCQMLKNAGAEVSCITAVIVRNDMVQKRLAEAGYSLYNVFNFM
jgi:orotate phosphoribosyltransferase